MSGYRIPKSSIITIVLIGFLVYTTVADAPSYGAQIRDAVGGPSVLKKIWAITAAVHAGESVYMAGLCKQHKTGLGLGVSLSSFSLSTEADLVLLLVALGTVCGNYWLSLPPSIPRDRSTRAYLVDSEDFLNVLARYGIRRVLVSREKIYR